MRENRDPLSIRCQLVLEMVAEPPFEFGVKAQGRDIAAHGFHEHASIACLNYTSYFEFHSIHLNGIA